jgi:hypothetical protein
LEREADEAFSPEDSAVALEAWIKSEGFSSYDTFQSQALAAEFEARARQMAEPLDTQLKRYIDMSRAIADVQVETANMTEAFEAIRTVPLNMRIIASRLENVGGPISAISVNYTQMLEEMTTWVKTFVDGDTCVFARIRDAILTGQFLSFAAAVEREMVGAVGDPDHVFPDAVDPAHEIALLSEHEQRFLIQAGDKLKSVEREARRFSQSVLDMKRFVTGLSSTRMMCKIESASLPDAGTALNGIVEQLDSCQTEIEERLARIMELNAVMQSNTAMLRSMV